jgi:hypothetical protein
MRQALDLVDVVLGHQFPRAGFREVAERGDAVKLPRGERLVTVRAVLVPGKGRMRLVINARLDVDVIDAVGDGIARGGIRQAPAGRIEIIRLRDGARRQRNQFIGAFQVMVLQRRLVDLAGELDFVRTVGLCRVEMIGPLLEGGEQYVFAGLSRGWAGSGSSPVAATISPTTVRQQPGARTRNANCRLPARAFRTGASGLNDQRDA